MEFPKYFVMAVASILNFFMPVSMAVNPNCDFYQDVIMGQEYYIYNNEYPASYGPSTSCRWLARSDVGTRMVVTCGDIAIPSTTSCSGDRLAISLTGNENFSDSRNYCGQGSVSLVSNGNSLAVGLFSTSNTPGGRFLCMITAIQDTSVPTTPTPPNTCDCGWKQGTRIVGGEETGVNEYPAMAGLIDLDRRDLYCGGTIISNRYVVSAAHCVSMRDSSNIGILVGDHDISTGLDTPRAALYLVSAYEMHPNYNSKTQVNDIAILQTSTPMNFSLYVGPICLPFKYTTSEFVGQTVTALGWGGLEFSGPTSDTLQKVNLTVISNNECAGKVKDPITSSQMCTYAPGKDACQSDSGGPLFWMDPSSRRLQFVGVISYGVGCATQLPGVNTRITSYLAWIVSRTSDANYCIK